MITLISFKVLFIYKGTKICSSLCLLLFCQGFYIYAHVLLNTIIMLHVYEFHLYCACGCLGPVICHTFQGHNADANNGGTDGLGRHLGHYDVTVMILKILKLFPLLVLIHCLLIVLIISVNSSSGNGLMPTPQAIAWINGDLRLLTSITFASISYSDGL